MPYASIPQNDALTAQNCTLTKFAVAISLINYLLIRSGKAGGNQHVLGGDLAGYKAIDIKGSGKGRGALRMGYKETDTDIFIHSIQDYH